MCTPAMRFTCAALLILAVSGHSQEPETYGCEANPTGDPIGGGKGYSRTVTSGTVAVTSAEELIRALEQAKKGDVVFVPSGTEIDLTGKRDLVIPEGVTLAGTRGVGDDEGPLLVDREKSSHLLFRTGGYGVRVTGLRIEGPFGGTERVGFSARGISLGHSHAEVDNCVISKFNVVGIGVGAHAIDVQIHHNIIRDCTRGGLGYGVSTSSSDVHIIANIFTNCRHHIASGGRPGSGYEAAWNLVLDEAISHHFDMHGGRDRGDGTDIAGDWMHVHHNTFKGKQRHVVIRGVPSQGARIHHNWFAADRKRAVVSGGNTDVYKNAYGPDKVVED